MLTRMTTGPAGDTAGFHTQSPGLRLGVKGATSAQDKTVAHAG
jgi:hypothetical protein